MEDPTRKYRTALRTIEGIISEAWGDSLPGDDEYIDRLFGVYKELGWMDEETNPTPAFYQENPELEATPKLPRNLKPVPIHKYDGGSRKYTLHAPYQQLVNTFGPAWRTDVHKNAYPDDDYKTDACWCLKSEDNQTLTIWNYKNRPNYLHEGTVEEITEWSVYCTSDALWREVEALFK